MAIFGECFSKFNGTWYSSQPGEKRVGNFIHPPVYFLSHWIYWSISKGKNDSSKYILSMLKIKEIPGYGDKILQSRN